MVLINDSQQREWNSHIRGGYIAIWLKGGSKLTTAEIVRLTGMSRQGVEFMMDILSSGMPITKIDSKWQWIDEKECEPK